MPRLQLDLSDTHDELITELMETCDLRTKKDVVENALILLGWAAHEAREGLLIAAVNEEAKVYKELQTPALIGARSKAERERKQASSKPSSKKVQAA